LYFTQKQVEKKLVKKLKFRQYMAGGDDVDESLYETAIYNTAKLLGAEIPENWKEQRKAFFREKWREFARGDSPSQAADAVEYDLRPCDDPMLECKNGCGFYASAGYNGYCSQCSTEEGEEKEKEVGQDDNKTRKRKRPLSPEREFCSQHTPAEKEE